MSAEVGIGRTTLQHFINAQTTPHPRVRRTLGLWYLEKISQAADFDIVRPYRHAMSTILADLPAERREAGERDLIRTAVGLYDDWGVQPRWVELLAGIPPPGLPEQ